MKKIIILIIIVIFVFSIGVVRADTSGDSPEYELIKAWHDKVVSFLNNIFARVKQEIENRMRQSLEEMLENLKNKILEAVF